jgi:hypothetical protein
MARSSTYARSPLTIPYRRCEPRTSLADAERTTASVANSHDVWVRGLP